MSWIRIVQWYCLYESVCRIKFGLKLITGSSWLGVMVAHRMAFSLARTSCESFLALPMSVGTRRHATISDRGALTQITLYCKSYAVELVAILQRRLGTQLQNSPLAGRQRIC